MSLLRVSGLSKSFGGIKAVDSVNFSVSAGELLAMIGPNGAGKSTTFNLVNGQLRADKGSVVLEGRDLVGLKPRQIWKLGVGRTFQIAETFASMTAAENVQLALLSADNRLYSPWQRATNYRRDDTLALLDQVGMAAYADRPCNTLAYGDVKRLELAIALAHQPKLLLMDEPTAGMAPRERNELMALTRRLVTEKKIAVLFTEHSMDVIFAHADRILVIARGRAIAQGRPTEIRDDAEVQKVYFGSGKTFEPARPADCASLKRPRCDRPQSAAGSAKTPLLAVRGLCAWYREAQILFDLDISVRRGEVVALLGRNGAGKSTTFKALMGMVGRRRGSLAFMDHDILHKETHKIAAMGLGFVPEDRRLFTDLTVMQNLVIGASPQRRWPDGSAAPLWTLERLFALFPNLATMKDRPAARMSGGEQKMLAVARTLLRNPYVILLDEPSEGVAPVIVEQMAQAIHEMKEQGVSILLSEQNMHFAGLVSDRGYVLEKGQILREVQGAELHDHEALQRAHVSI